MTFSQKESDFLQDLKSKEQLCVDKYEKYSAEARDGNLSNLFSQIGKKEQEHLNTINQIIGGNVPQINPSSESQSNSISVNMNSQSNAQDKQKDEFLCTDALSTEKHVSSVYDTSIFEFKDPNVRNVLNHIQKEEQEHGENIYNYMAQNGMYC